MSNRHRIEPCPTMPLMIPGEQMPGVEPMAGLVDIDAGIAPLVEALLKAGFQTYSSCEGHPWSGQDSRAYVVFDWHGVDVELRVWPADVVRLADSLTNL